MLRNFILSWVGLDIISKQVWQLVMDRSEDFKQISAINKRINELELKIIAQQDVYNLKIEQLTRTPVERPQPIELKPPSWQRTRRKLESDDRKRAQTMRDEVTQDMIDKGVN